MKKIIGTRETARRLAILRNEGVLVSPSSLQEKDGGSPSMELVEFEVTEEEVEYLRTQGYQFAVLYGQEVEGKGETLRAGQADLFPDLLAACREALTALESPEAQHVLVWITQREALKAVIAKAELL